MARKMTGLVASDSNDKTILVSVTRRETHPIYGKQYTVTVKFQAHDEKNEARRGDRVVIEESRPISRNKTWKLVEIVERGHEIVEIKKTEVEEEAEAKLAEKAAKKAAAEESEAKVVEKDQETVKKAEPKKAEKAKPKGDEE